MTADACPDQRPVEREYARVVERHRDELHAHSRRILRSSQDAEDALQEALLRAWRALPSFEGRSSLRSWLFRIVTNASLDVIKRRRRLIVPMEYASLVGEGEADPQDHYERRESIERAVATAERILPERQRTVLMLREVLGLSARETANRLGTSVPAVNSALQRARARIDRRLDEQSTHETTSSLEDPRGRASESA